MTSGSVSPGAATQQAVAQVKNIQANL
jgi:hypothetical protein